MSIVPRMAHAARDYEHFSTCFIIVESGPAYRVLYRQTAGRLSLHRRSIRLPSLPTVRDYELSSFVSVTLGALFDV